MMILFKYNYEKFDDFLVPLEKVLKFYLKNSIFFGISLKLNNATFLHSQLTINLLCNYSIKCKKRIFDLKNVFIYL